MKTKRITFSRVAGVDVEVSRLFFNVELKVAHQQSLIFISFVTTFFLKLRIKHLLHMLRQGC